MAKLYKRVGGRVFEQAIAMDEGVQDYLRNLLFEMQAHASVLLIEHRHEGHARIEVDHGRVDWYLVLSDEHGEKAALSIEFGRAPYVDPETGKMRRGTEGLFILHRATKLPRRTRTKVKV